MGSRLDDLMTVLGTGSWQILHIFTLCYWFCIMAFHTLAGAFLAPKINYTCLPPPQDITNLTQESCGYTVDGVGGREERPCLNWSFDNSTFYSTITSDFELVCDREYLRTTYQSIYMFGIFVGAPVNGFLADRFGRLPMVSIGSVLFSIMAVGSSWMTNFSLLLFTRFLMGTLHPTSLQTGYILAMEMVETKWRTELGIVLFLPWALGTMAWGGAAYLIRDWRWLQLAISLPCFLILPMLCMMDESPRWLAVHGKPGRALKVLKKAARRNKASLPDSEEILYILKDDKAEMSQPKDAVRKRNFKTFLRAYLEQVIILFRTSRMRLITVVMCVDYLVTGMVYFGLSLSSTNFSANPFVYMVLTGLMEVPSNSLILPVVKRFGRRCLTAFFFLFCGAVLLALPFMHARIEWLVVTLAMLGKMSISAVFNILFLYSTEVFPTEVRSRGMGISFMMSRIGSIISPFITDYLGFVYPWAPSVVFGVSSVVAGLATLALPETKGAALPDTIAKVEGLKSSDSSH